MAILDIQISYEGKTPITGTNGDAKRVSVDNLAQLLYALNHGSRYKQGNGYVQVQETMVAAFGTVTPAAVQSGDTVTINGQALTAAQKRATGTVTAATAIAGNTVTINGQVFTGTAGAVTPGDATFSIDTGNTATATSLAAQVNAYGGSKVAGLVAAKSSGAVVTLYAVNQGTSGNALTLASSDGATLAVSGATLANGAAVANNAFDFAGSNATTGAALAYAINNSTTAALKFFTATVSAAGVVTVTAKIAGVGGNAYTFVSSNGTRLAVTGSGTLTSGAGGTLTRWAF